MNDLQCYHRKINAQLVYKIIIDFNPTNHWPLDKYYSRKIANRISYKALCTVCEKNRW